MPWLFVVLACESVPTSGGLFTPAPVASPPVAGGAAAAADPRFERETERFRISSEEMADGGLAAEGPSVADAAIAAGATAPSDSSPAPTASPAAAAPVPLGVGRFPVRLVSTLAQAQPPRAVLGLPDGREIVVSPGAVLGDEALVVMAVMEGRVQLAEVRAAGDHAEIHSLELSAQYP
jgi:hypothetical protein